MGHQAHGRSQANADEKALREIAQRRIDDINAHLPLLRRRIPVSDHAMAVYQRYLAERERLEQMLQ